MEEKTPTKFHALQLFTDTFTAETVHLTNEAIGIYIRLICFSWTKNTKPFTTESAYRICQCIDNNCYINVYEILEEFFILTLSPTKKSCSLAVIITVLLLTDVFLEIG